MINNLLMWIDWFKILRSSAGTPRCSLRTIGGELLNYRPTADISLKFEGIKLSDDVGGGSVPL